LLFLPSLQQFPALTFQLCLPWSEHVFISVHPVSEVIMTQNTRACIKRVFCTQASIMFVNNCQIVDRGSASRQQHMVRIGVYCPWWVFGIMSWQWRWTTANHLCLLTMPTNVRSKGMYTLKVTWSRMVSDHGKMDTRQRTFAMIVKHIWSIFEHSSDGFMFKGRTSEGFACVKVSWER
jgi:hypothetical protein